MMLYINRGDHSGLNGGCTAIWNVSGKLAHYYFSWIVCFQKQTNTRILDNFKEKRKYRISKEEAVDDTLEIRFGRGYGPVRLLQNRLRKKWPRAQPAVTLELLAFCPYVVLCFA